MKTAGKRIASFGLAMLLTVTCAWQAASAGWLDFSGISEGYSQGQSQGYSQGFSLGESEQTDDTREQKEEPKENNVVEKPEQKDTPMAAPAAAPVGLPVAAPPNNGVNIVKDIQIHGVQDTDHTNRFYVTDTVSVRIDMGYNGPIREGMTTVIKFPDNLELLKTADMNITNASANNKVIAVATIDPVGNQVSITSTDGAVNASKVTAFLTLSVKFKKSKFSDPNFTSSIDETFKFFENNTPHVLVKTILDKGVSGSEHMLWKGGEYEGNDIIQWESSVNWYTTPQRRWNLKDVVIEDVVGEGHELVLGSIEVIVHNRISLENGGIYYYGEKKITSGYGLAITEDSKGFTIKIPNDLKVEGSDFANAKPYPYTIYYRTRIIDNYNKKEYKNTIWMHTDDTREEDDPWWWTNSVWVSAASGGKTIDVNLTIEKVDADDADVKLADAVFDLRDESGRTLETLITDSKGKAVYNGALLLEQKYYLHEVLPPSSVYEALTEPRVITIPAEKDLESNTTTLTLTEQIANKKAKLGILKIRKLDYDTKNTEKPLRLSGATFVLYSDEKLTKQVGDRYNNVSWKTGTGVEPEVALIEGIPVGTYWLVELEPPEGYQKLKGPVKVQVEDNPSGISTVELYNQRDAFDLTIWKEDADSGAKLSGGKYTAYRYSPTGNWTEVDTFTIADKDKGYTRKVIVGEYRIWEDQAPDGYKLPNEYTYFTITEEDKAKGKYELVLKNDLIPADQEPDLLSVLAYSHEDENYENALSGAGLRLLQFQNEKWEPVLEDEVTTGNTGKSGVIGGLSEGVYRFAPVIDPEGYTAVEEYQTFELKKAYAAKSPIQIDVPYQNKSATLKIVKRDMDDNSTLPGATFTLQREDGTNYFTRKVTGNNGEIIVRNIPYGEYTLWEVEAPEGYYTPGRAIPITINEEEETIYVTNKVVDLDKAADVKLIKHATGNENTRLEGAEFELYHWENGKMNLYLGGLTTNEEGEIPIRNLPFGAYQFVETKAPEGYTISGDGVGQIYALNSTTQGVKTVKVANPKSSTGNPGGSGTDSREKDKGSNNRDTYAYDPALVDPSSDSYDPPGVEIASGNRSSFEIADANNPFTGMYDSPILAALLALAMSCMVLGGILMFAFRKEE